MATLVPTLPSLGNFGSYSGMAGGNAFDAIISGRITPSLGNDKTNPPRLSNSNDTKPKGAPTIAPLASGNVVHTTIDDMNNSLAHACDFILEMKKSIGLKKFIKAIASGIRQGIRSLMRVLGLTDATGEFYTITATLKMIAEDLNYIKKEWIEPIIDFEKEVIEVLIKVQEVVSFILSLPAKLITLLKDCLTKLYNTLKNIFLDALKEAAAEVPLGGGNSGLQAVMDAGKSAADSLQSLGDSLQSVVTMGNQASSDLLNPTSSADISSGLDTIVGYGNSLTSPTPTPQPTVITNSRP